MLDTLFQVPKWDISLLYYLFAALIVYYVGVGVYRVYFHPLAKFPGPKVQCFALKDERLMSN
jgi:hypothetical protein